MNVKPANGSGRGSGQTPSLGIFRLMERTEKYYRRVLNTIAIIFDNFEHGRETHLIRPSGLQGRPSVVGIYFAQLNI